MPANRDHRSAERPDRNGARQDVDARDIGPCSPDTTEARREEGAPWRNGRVCYESTLRVRIKSSMANQVEQLFTEHKVPAWRELQARGELLSVTLVRVEASEVQYDLVTQWASKDAHDRNADTVVAEVYALAMACYIAARARHRKGRGTEP